jgi:heme/copper-type cytochrome/quinol oxidase subunit 2
VVFPVSRPTLTALLTGSAVMLLVGAVAAGAVQSRREFSVAARKYSYRVEGADKPEIHVREGDLVHITFSSEDIPHSFTLVENGEQHYRLMRRAEPGKPVTFDFVADKPGTYEFQCTLRADERCKEMVGTLIVDAKR